MMKKKLVKHGNSSVLVIDKAIMKLLGLAEDAEVAIRIEGNQLIMEAVSQDEYERIAAGNKKFDASTKKILKKYRSMFQKLADM